MALIDDVKSKFPLWDQYCLDPTTQDPSDALLQQDMDRATGRMQDYIPLIDQTNMTDPLEEHFVSIVKYLSFNRRHDDAEFENKPTIIKDYEYTMKILERYKNGDFSFDPTPEDTTDNTDRIKMDAKDRLFGKGNWFNSRESE